MDDKRKSLGAEMFPAGKARSAATAKRDRAIRRAVAKADDIDPTWRGRAIAAALELARTRTQFTAEHVTRRAPIPAGADPRSIGGIFKGLAARRLIRRVAIVPTSNPKHHAGHVSVWGGTAKAAAMPSEG